MTLDDGATHSWKLPVAPDGNTVRPLFTAHVDGSPLHVDASHGPVLTTEFLFHIVVAEMDYSSPRHCTRSAALPANICGERASFLFTG